MNATPRVAQPVFSRSFGTGPRRALALHCTLAHAGAWRGVAGEIGGTVTLIAPDMLTHGASPDWDGQGDFLDRSVDAVAHLLEPGMDLIGHSFGATIALSLAATYPGKTRSLTLIEPVFIAVALRDAPGLVAEIIVEQEPFRNAMRAGDNALAARLFNRMWSDGGPRWPEMPETLRAMMTRSISIVPACDPALFDDRAGLLEPGILAQVTAPCLIVQGSNTHPVVGAVCKGLARRLPDATSVVIDGAGHMLPITHPAETAAELKRLFARSQRCDGQESKSKAG